MIRIDNIAVLAGLWDAGKPFVRGKEMCELPALRNAWLRFDEIKGTIVDYGTMDSPELPDATEELNACGGWIIPAFCDSHTHIIYAGSREGEFRDKIAGLSYEEIARRGGGILNSADRLHLASEQELYDSALRRLHFMMSSGTGSIEIKSGYGLKTADELKMLRVAARLRESVPALVRCTFLGAHAVGREYQGRQEEYVSLVINEMLPAVAAEGLADFVDVFCDEGFFTPDQTAHILEAAAKYGLRPKIHANELAASGGVQVGLRYDALSVDHLERAGERELALLGKSECSATMLPGASFFLGMPYAPARKAVENNCIVTLASDYNPGSSPSGSMRMIMSLGCIKMKLTPEESLAACTLNGAYAMGVNTLAGSIAPGKCADFIITSPLPDLAYLPYAYTEPLIKDVYLAGKRI